VTTTDRLARLVAPVADELGLVVYDVEDASGTLRVLLDSAEGVDIDTLSDASRRISRSMDEDGSFSSTALLEVSSPGLERKLRTPEHMAGALGERVKVKLRPGVDGERRIEGVLSAVGDGSITVSPDNGGSRTVALDDVTSARTVFEWGPAPKPGKGSRGAGRSAYPRAVDPSPPVDPKHTDDSSDQTDRADMTDRSDTTEATP